MYIKFFQSLKTVLHYLIFDLLETFLLLWHKLDNVFLMKDVDSIFGQLYPFDIQSINQSY